MLHTQYRKDKATAWITPTAGVELEVSHFDPRQPDYVNNMTKLTKPVRKLVEQNLLPPEKDREYAIKAFTKTCVKNWRQSDGNGGYHEGIEIATPGEYVRFSEDEAVKVFMAYPQFYSDVVELTRDLSAFQVTEDEVGNSATA